MIHKIKINTKNKVFKDSDFRLVYNNNTGFIELSYVYNPAYAINYIGTSHIIK